MADDKKETKRDLATPLAETPVFDLTSALSDINTRAAARQKSISDSNAKLSAAREERNKNKRSVAGGGGTLHGLASFSDRTRLQQ